MNNARRATKRALIKVFRQKQLRHIVDWADRYMWLPPGSSNNSALIRWKTYGYQKLPLHAFADLDTKVTVVKKSVQVGLSKCALIVIGYESSHRNRSNGIWLPATGDASEFSNVQIHEMLEYCPEVSSQLKVDYDKRDKENTTRRRSYYGAQSYCRGTQTLQDVSSISVEHAIGDEVSKYPQQLRGTKDNVGKTPVDGIRGRLKSASDPCLSLLSTPTEFGTCQITEQFEECREQFHRGYTCPGCGNWHVFEWGDEKTEHGFKWTNVYDEFGEKDLYETSRTVYYQCPHCEHKHHWEDLDELDEAGEWRSERLRFDEKEYQYYSLETGEQVPSPYSVGIQIRGWFNRRDAWSEIVLAFLEAVRDLAEGKPKKMVDWTQDYLAEAYRSPETSDYVKHGYLMSRQEGTDYGAECPSDVQAIFKDWDVQGDRIECLTVGFGPKHECYLIKKYTYWGDPKTSDVLKHVQRHTDKTYRKPNGFEMPVFLSGIDARYLPDDVNAICAKEYKFKIIPHMGSKSLGKPLVQGRTSASKEYGTFLTTLCPDTGKDMIYAMYRCETPGPGYVHIPDIECFDEKFIKQMVAEIKKIVNGVMRWFCADGVRNEGLDLMVGCLAMCILAEQRFGLRFVPKHEYKDAVLEDEDEVTIQDLIKAAKA